MGHMRIEGREGALERGGGDTEKGGGGMTEEKKDGCYFLLSLF
jgi:hypothetical protein